MFIKLFILATAAARGASLVTSGPRPTRAGLRAPQFKPARRGPPPLAAAAPPGTAGAAASSSGTKKKILFLISDTGGGHRASANALVDAMARLYPERVDASIVDIWTDHTCWPYRRFVPWYAIAAKRTYLWRLIWYYGRFWPTRKFQEVATRLQCFGRFRRAIEAEAPDMVVSVHPLCQDIPLRVLRRMGGGARAIPFVTVVTDLGSAHNTWFDARSDFTFVPSEPLYAMAERCGLDRAKLRLRGLPLREGFWAPEPRPRPAVRAALGLPDAPTALVVGGGDGVGGIAGVATAISDALGAAGAPAASSLVVVCGRNDAARAALEGRAWPPSVSPQILGFVDNMHEYMAAADCIVTKAGPGTIAEAATRGLPCLLSSHLPGQEFGNVKYVESAGFGAFTKKTRDIAETVARWLARDADREKLAAAARAAARPNATLDIARDIGDLLFEGRAPQP